MLISTTVMRVERPRLPGNDPSCISTTVMRVERPMRGARERDLFGGEPTRVALFHSTHYAIRAEKVAGEEGLKVKLIPIPRHLSSDCGVCLRHLASESDRLRGLLESKGVEYDRFEDY